MTNDLFTTTHFSGPCEPIRVSVPHAGRSYDPKLFAQLRVPIPSIRSLEDRYADRLVETATAAGIPTIVAHAPRLMIDLNRAPDDLDPDSVTGSVGRQPVSARARSGLGLIPTRLWGVGSLWRESLAPEDVMTRLHDIHTPYHATIASGLDAARQRWGTALLIDLHSMPPLEGADRPDIVIGDRFGSTAASWLTAMAESIFKGLGFRVAINVPYAGGYIITRHAKPRANVHALQIEVDRSLYLDTALNQPGPGLEHMQRAIAYLIGSLNDELTGRIAQAAE